MNLGGQLERFDFRYLIGRALSKVSPEVDTREGSIIYDALAPACYELADMYMQLKLYYQATFAQTSFDNYLDLRVAEQGLIRGRATRAVKLASFENSDGEPMLMADGSRFATIHPTDSIIYAVANASNTAGVYELECEIVGTDGNNYVGELLPVTHINGLGSATMTELLVPGQNAEDDESLRARFFEAVNTSSFGGNITQYREEVLAIDGVGAVQVYPVWRGGGSVKLSILTSDLQLATNSFIELLQNEIDPRSEGKGLGIAPIGHRVTVSTATEKQIDINVQVSLTTGTYPAQARDAVVTAIQSYFDMLRQNWDISNMSNQYSMVVLRSQIVVAMMGVQGVADVSNLMLNGMDSDVVLTQNGEIQEIPMLGEVAINAN